MRRKDREVTDPERIRAAIDRCQCCRVGFFDGEEVYIVPLSFGYEERDGKRLFYFHGAREGRKVDLAARASSVGFELDTDYCLQEAESTCEYSAAFVSVIGTGRISFVENEEEKREALLSIMRHSAGKDAWTFSQAALQAVQVFRLDVEKLSCKEHP